MYLHMKNASCHVMRHEEHWRQVQQVPLLACSIAARGAGVEAEAADFLQLVFAAFPDQGHALIPSEAGEQEHIVPEGDVAQRTAVAVVSHERAKSSRSNFRVFMVFSVIIVPFHSKA